MDKKCLAVFLIVCILFSFAPCSVYAENQNYVDGTVSLLSLSNQDVTQRLDGMRSILEGKYWNADLSESQLISAVKAGYFMPGKYSESQYEKYLGLTHDGCKGSYRKEGCTSNSFQSSSQCRGFAKFVFYALFGKKTTSCTNLEGNAIGNNTLEPGDYIADNGHGALVWKVIGDSLYTVECFGTCRSYRPGCKIVYSNGFNGTSYTTVSGMLAHLKKDNGLLVKHPGSVMVVDTPAATPAEPHIHSWTTGYDGPHPHNQFIVCSGCGEKQYTGQQLLDTSCKQCFPVGNVRLTRSFEKTGGKVTFYRNDVTNAYSYTLTLYKGVIIYDTYTMSQTSLTLSGLPSGSYSAKLSAKNTNTGESRIDECESFTLLDTYRVLFNANGGTGAPADQTKIQNTTLTLSSTVPKKTGHVFLGWASSKTATEPQYTAGGSYTKNAKITLYAVWEPETYTIRFDANGGKGTLNDVTIIYGDTMKMPNSVVREGYYLKGWSASKGGAVDYKLNIDYKMTASTTLYAVWDSTTWDGDVATSFSGGDGTRYSPYQISNAAELAHLADVVNSQTDTPEYGYYILTDNISLGYEEWVPIGVYDNENQLFCGNFDGNGYTISDLSISNAYNGYVGLFGYAKDSVVKNLTVTADIAGITTTNVIYCGAIIGKGYSVVADSCNGSYINVTDISGSPETGCVGALFGQLLAGSLIKDCAANECYVSVKSGYYDVGTMAGSVWGAASDCTVTATDELIGSAADTNKLIGGGLFGALTGNVTRCKVESGYLSSKLTSTGSLYVGGLLGWAGADTEVKLCSVDFNEGPTRTIDGASYRASLIATGSGGWVKAGGLVGYAGYNGFKIKDCKYDGKSIFATGASEVATGGIIADYYGGTDNSSIKAQGGLALDREALPKKAGYTATWYTDANFRNEYDFSQPVTSNLTLYVKWEEGSDEPDIWDGTMSEPAYDASTETYTIANGEELAWVAGVTNGKITNGTNFPDNTAFSGYTVQLANDIYLNDPDGWENWETAAPRNKWMPIGENTAFDGVFDGKNYCIQGIYVRCVNGECSGAGLFCAATEIIRNVSLRNGVVAVDGVADISVGGICGISDNCRFSNCYNECTIRADHCHYVGGIIGNGVYDRPSGTIIYQCGNTGSVYGDKEVGGIVGSNNDGTIFCCYNKGKIEGNICVGGIAGRAKAIPRTVWWWARPFINTCYNMGNITAKGFDAGGIVGYTGAFNGDDDVRVISDDAVSVKECHNSGSIAAGSRAGGIIGYSDCTYIEDVYNIGTLAEPRGYYAAGIVADVYSRNADGYTIESAYSTIGPIYILEDENSILTASKTDILTISLIKTLALLSGFSTSTWAQDTEGINNGYVYLKNLKGTYKTYSVKVIDDIGDSTAINRVFANANGILFANSFGNPAYAGGILGKADARDENALPSRNLLVIADRISSVSGNSGYYANTGDIAGSVINNALDFSNTHSYSSMDLSSVNTAKAANISLSNISSSRTLAQIKRASFLRQVFGTPYQSLAYLEEDPESVWVIKDGELPELYFNVLNDIVEAECENGIVAVDKVQAVDGEIVNVAAEPNPGYKLNKIYVNGEEIVGSTFEVSGDSVVYATFAEKTAVYDVSVAANENAIGTLTNLDAEVSLFAATNSLSAEDGEEIGVSTTASADYTVDTIYVNGEEIAGNSFILTENTVVTMDVTNVSTVLAATTGEAEVTETEVTLNGELAVNVDEAVRYILYWDNEDPGTVYTTETESGNGSYSVTLPTVYFTPDTTYSYQMTSDGDVKSFYIPPVIYDDDTGEGEDEGPEVVDTPAITETTVKRLTSTIKFSVESSIELDETTAIIVVLYDGSDAILSVKHINGDGDTSYSVSTPIDTDAKYARIFVWNLDRLQPFGGVEMIQIK